MPTVALRRAAFWLIALGVCGLLPAASADSGAAQRTLRLGGYALSVEPVAGAGGMGEELLTIRKDGRLSYAETGARIQFSTPDEPLADLPEMLPITGDGARDIVVQSYSGGAHCCFTVTIVTLADSLTSSRPLDTQSAGARLFKLPQGGRYGIETAEGTFDYWRSPFVASPKPRLFLRYDAASGRYRLVPTLMRKPAPSRAVLDATAKQLRDDPEAWAGAPEWVNPAYLRAVIDLVYGGNLEAAHVLAAEAWPDSRPDRDAFLRDLFSCRLPSSPWWSDIAALDGIKPYGPAPDCR